MFGLFKKRKKPVGSVSLVFLQQRLERFADERLNRAMQNAWRRPYDSRTFFAISVFDGEGALLKFDKVSFGILHFDRRLHSRELGGRELPAWARHTAHSRLEYGCPGGVPAREMRNRMYAIMGKLCAELLTPQTSAIFFGEEGVFRPNTSQVVSLLRSAKSLDPNCVPAAAEPGAD